mgnify:CR=1 FL=1|jgi:tetratricopeptide (TPR) repeat protein
MENHLLAIEDFKRAINLDKKYAKALFCRGISLLRSKEIKEAIEDFEEAACQSENTDEDIKVDTLDGLG